MKHNYLTYLWWRFRKVQFQNSIWVKKMPPSFIESSQIRYNYIIGRRCLDLEFFFFYSSKLFISLLDPLTHHFSSYIVRITALHKLSISPAVFPIKTCWKEMLKRKSNESSFCLYAQTFWRWCTVKNYWETKWQEVEIAYINTDR